MTTNHLKLILTSLFAVFILVLVSVGLIIMNNAVTEMKKSNERPVETDWTTFPGWPDNYPVEYTIPWPDKYSIDYTIEWPDDQTVTVAKHKPVWAETLASQLQNRGGHIYLDGDDFVINKLSNPTVTAEEDYLKVIFALGDTGYMCVPYDKIVYWRIE